MGKGPLSRHGVWLVVKAYMNVCRVRPDTLIFRLNVLFACPELWARQSPDWPSESRKAFRKRKLHKYEIFHKTLRPKKIGSELAPFPNDMSMIKN
jgi:hypothetical protein